MRGAPRRRTTQRDGRNDFVRNAELLQEVIKSKKRLGENPALKASAMTPRLAQMLVMMVNRYAMLPNWYGYSYNDEMKGDALVNLCNKWHKFDETKYSNPFAYYTTIIYTCFLGGHAREKKVQMIRDNLLEHYGMSPSMTRQIENEMKTKQADLEETIAIGVRDAEEPDEEPAAATPAEAEAPKAAPAP